MNSGKYLPVNYENNTEAGPGRYHMLPRTLPRTVSPDGAPCTEKRTHLQRSCYRIIGLLMNARQNDLHGEMHRSYGVSKQCVATHIVPRDTSPSVSL
jgi:hypothetical protein